MWIMKKKVIYFIFFLLILMVLRLFFIEVYTINQSSMKNTYGNGVRVLILKNLYTLKQNDIVIFKRNKENLIKRCIGMPGDSIKIINGKIYLNNKFVSPPPSAILKYSSDIDIFTKSDIYYNYGRNWTPYNMGAYKIPKKGMKIILTPEIISLYQNLINSEVNNNFNVTNNKNWKNNKYYTFQNDYYFLVGDNRAGSIDSRTFGPINILDLKGKVILSL
ncbi:signal peptidase I [Elizabethkingia miricola]|nr:MULTISPECIES: signal peptidase I [Weeksellaceae]MDV3492892.1 signal peptidase I [Elizabethkingia anophelis]MDV4129605.1 signal peptidase I [Elizabethkingia anophelis]MDV4133293.1 signal peptidase I [Elizabethkingia anophelis]OPB90013.1 signal peptidase I [Elizabethkingia miricola]OPC56163.1 signal peptidase I [Elizabethkingia anophelis]